ncbi:MAG: hypothetical protein DHS20C16_27120 [Phycisphaerae bacterium]|nr:MAG: hypothetical protein DHS20C16_27120 [Phycisphaerae bacterium]
MGLTVSLVIGPRHAGKSLLVQIIKDEVCKSQPHLLRLIPSDRETHSSDAPAPCQIANDGSCKQVIYDPERVFETLPEILTRIHAQDRYGCVIIEGDADPNLLQAYPYDFEIFIMPAPECETDIFRSKDQVKKAFEAAMNDTAAFTSEIFGVEGVDDSWSGERKASRPDMSETQMIRLLDSPLGQELASRIQCRPDYHGLIDSNAIVVNTGIGATSGAADAVVARLEKLINENSPSKNNRSIYCCDVLDPHDPRRKKLLAHLEQGYPLPRRS